MVDSSISSENAILPFCDRLRHCGISPLTAQSIDILQINLGRRCNLSCRHCHVQAGPDRTEIMSRRVMEQSLELANIPDISTIDITGGAPEMHPELEWFLQRVSMLDKRIIVRSNLAILLDPQYAHFMDVFANGHIEVVGSLPDVHAAKTDRQRGAGVFAQAIAALQQLNARGYGLPRSELLLDLVHNPVGAFIPGPQCALEQEYRRILTHEHGVSFNRLFCITNSPSGRYLQYLLQSGNYEDYMRSLVSAYNPAAARKVMCRTALSVGWDGRLYDCDFNQALGLTVNHGAPDHIDKFDMELLSHREIVVADHCYACTAGAGSSCQGAVDG